MQMALISGSASDIDSAKTRCKSLSAQIQENEKLADSKKFTDINFTWQTLKRDGYIESLGRETSEAFMSLIGTIIYNHNSDPIFIQPNIFDENYMKSLINGGSIKIKQCDETSRCLHMNDKNIIISSNTAYKTRIKIY